jgi:glutathione S-transferase
MPAYHLISHDLCPYVQRAVIALAEKRVAFKRTYVDLANKPEWFRQISPLGKTPILKVDDQVLFESAVICDYLDEVEAPRLHPAEPLARARHRAWVEFASATLNAIGAFYNAPDAVALERQRVALTEKFATLEEQLNKHDGPYFAGTDFSLVDAAFGPVFRYFDVFDSIRDFRIFENTPRVACWRATLAQRPSVRDAAVEDYPERLRVFLLKRNSALSGLMLITSGNVSRARRARASTGNRDG